MKPELLSPVGNKEMLYQAIHNGADAVYLAGTKYGARKYAENFTESEIEETIKYAHLYGVKVYITVNTLIYEEETEEFLNYIKFLYQNNVDALIMQDIGMIDLVRQTFPDIEIHASTQCHIYNKETINLLLSLGISRVVLARETSKDTIKLISNNKIETEVFIHGALCICYSGCCLFSSMNGGRSGNRGECVASCRKPYGIVINNKEYKTKGNYLLSTKDLNTSPKINELLDLGISSLKIEGRMKSPEYVGYITHVYRTLIDNYYNNKSTEVSQDITINIKKLFNRDFTTGYIFNDDNIMNMKTPNNIGIRIGKVIEVTPKRIKILLEDTLNQEDGIKFISNDLGMIVNKIYDKKDNLINKGLKDQIIEVDNKIGLDNNDIVHKTIDVKLVNELKNISLKKIPIEYTVTARINKPLVITISDGNNTVTNTGINIESALNKETIKEEIITNLSRLGDTPFIPVNFNITIDKNVFVPLSVINNMRRELTNKLIVLREGTPKQVTKHKYVIKVPKKDITNKISILVRNEEQLQVCLENNINNIYIDNYELYNQYSHLNNIYYKVSRIEEKYPSISNKNILATSLGAIYKYKENNYICSDYTLNVVNNYSLDVFNKLGIKRITLSPELNYNQIKKLNTNYNIELLIYGKIELMVIKKCIIKDIVNDCNNCHKELCYLKDINNRAYPLIRNNCHNYIYNYRELNIISDIPKYKELGITNYRIDLLLETKEEVKNIINRVMEEINK